MKPLEAQPDRLEAAGDEYLNEGVPC